MKVWGIWATLAFAILNNGLASWPAHVLQDKMVTAIARYTG